jgi:hypothetical protein
MASVRSELDPHLAPMSREQFLAATLLELADCYLDVSCTGCPKITVCPLKLMGRRHGRSLRLQDAIARMRCSYCRCAPASILFEARTIGAALPLGLEAEVSDFAESLDSCLPLEGFIRCVQNPAT